jgi:hypothetical protein
VERVERGQYRGLRGQRVPGGAGEGAPQRCHILLSLMAAGGVRVGRGEAAVITAGAKV